MNKFGLIGHPIAHSLSPALFKAGYKGRFSYDLIEGDDFDRSYQKFIDGYDGINVTAPFKELAYSIADLHSEECRLIKAANLLLKTKYGIKAYNSDYLGVRKWLSEVAPDTGRGDITCLIAGCGGAGKAAAIAAASSGLKVILMNRDIEKARGIAESIGMMGRSQNAEVRKLDEFREGFMESDIIIYNIPTAIKQLDELTSADFQGHRSENGSFQKKYILEANYKNPSFDNLLIDRMMNANPMTVYTGGEKWLLYQAITGYLIFTGETPDLASMEAVI